MTIAALLVAGRSNGVVHPLPFNSTTSSPGGGGTTTWRLTFDNNGALSFTSADTAGTSILTNNEWYFPRTTDIGATHWVRMTVTLGTSPSPGTVDAWTQMSTSQVWDWVRTTVGTTTATITLEVSTASTGTPVVASKAGIALSLEKNV